MRIAVFHHLRAGGGKRALYEYCKVLTRRGHHVEAFTLATADEAFCPLTEVTAKLHVAPFAVPALVQTRWLPFALQYLNLARRWALLDDLAAAQARIAAQIDAGGFELAFVHHDWLTQSPYVLRHLKTPSAYYCAEPLRRFYERPLGPPPPEPQGWKGRVRAAWYAPIEPIYNRRLKADDYRNAASAGLLLTNSTYSVESIARAYGLVAAVGRLGVDTELFQPGPEQREHRVVSVGRFQENKCQALIIEAVAKLPAERRPGLTLVGEGTGTAAYRDHLVALAAARGVALTLLENASDAALVQAYQLAKLAVFTPVLEPLGFVPLEAAACATPTVGVREAGVRETVVDGVTGLLAEREAGAIARAIEDLLTDEPRRARMGAAALAHVRREWSWERAGELLEQRFEAFLGR